MKKYIIIYMNGDNFGLIVDKTFDLFEDAKNYVEREIKRGLIPNDKMFKYRIELVYV